MKVKKNKENFYTYQTTEVATKSGQIFLKQQRKKDDKQWGVYSTTQSSRRSESVQRKGERSRGKGKIPNTSLI